MKRPACLAMVVVSALFTIGMATAWGMVYLSPSHWLTISLLGFYLLALCIFILDGPDFGGQPGQGRHQKQQDCNADVDVAAGHGCAHCRCCRFCVLRGNERVQGALGAVGSHVPAEHQSQQAIEQRQQGPDHA